MSYALKRSLPLVYIGLNVACVLVVLHADYRVPSVVRAEHRTYTDSVDAITFFGLSARALLFALLINSAWIAKAVVDAWRRRSYESFVWLGDAGAVWATAILFARLVW